MKYVYYGLSFASNFVAGYLFYLDVSHFSYLGVWFVIYSAAFMVRGVDER